MQSVQIVITLGPSSFNREFLTSINQYNNIYLLRINLSHTSLKDLPYLVQLVRSYTSIPICFDSEGAQLRCQRIALEEIYLKKDSIIKIHYTEVIGDRQNISFYPLNIVKQFEIGDLINIDFNTCSIIIEEKYPKFFVAKVLNSGLVKSNRASDINRQIQLPAITLKDKKAFKIGKELGIKHYALSFTNTADNVKLLRTLLPKKALVTSKIESINGLINLDSILATADDILIDRGDLSREVPIETIPFFQRLIVKKANSLYKPVMIATNLLESMIQDSVPTRAEVNDIIYTLRSGADRLVLAAETAIGKYPLRTIKVITTLIENFGKWNDSTSITDILLSLGKL